jgi:hypothetical protein
LTDKNHFLPARLSPGSPKGDRGERLAGPKNISSANCELGFPAFGKDAFNQLTVNFERAIDRWEKIAMICYID